MHDIAHLCVYCSQFFKGIGDVIEPHVVLDGRAVRDKPESEPVISSEDSVSITVIEPRVPVGERLGLPKLEPVGDAATGDEARVPRPLSKMNHRLAVTELKARAGVSGGRSRGNSSEGGVSAPRFVHNKNVVDGVIDNKNVGSFLRDKYSSAGKVVIEKRKNANHLSKVTDVKKLAKTGFGKNDRFLQPGSRDKDIGVIAKPEEGPPATVIVPLIHREESIKSRAKRVQNNKRSLLMDFAAPSNTFLTMEEGSVGSSSMMGSDTMDKESSTVQRPIETIDQDADTDWEALLGPIDSAYDSINKVKAPSNQTKTDNNDLRKQGSSLIDRLRAKVEEAPSDLDATMSDSQSAPSMISSRSSKSKRKKTGSGKVTGKFGAKGGTIRRMLARAKMKKTLHPTINELSLASRLRMGQDDPTAHNFKRYQQMKATLLLTAPIKRKMNPTKLKEIQDSMRRRPFGSIVSSSTASGLGLPFRHIPKLPGGIRKGRDPANFLRKGGIAANGGEKGKTQKKKKKPATKTAKKIVSSQGSHERMPPTQAATAPLPTSALAPMTMVSALTDPKTNQEKEGEGKESGESEDYLPLAPPFNKSLSARTDIEDDIDFMAELDAEMGMVADDNDKGMKGGDGEGEASLYGEVEEELAGVESMRELPPIAPPRVNYSSAADVERERKAKRIELLKRTVERGGKRPRKRKTLLVVAVAEVEDETRVEERYRYDGPTDKGPPGMMKELSPAVQHTRPVQDLMSERRPRARGDEGIGGGGGGGGGGGRQMHMRRLQFNFPHKVPPHRPPPLQSNSGDSVGEAVEDQYDSDFEEEEALGLREFDLDGGDKGEMIEVLDHKHVPETSDCVTLIQKIISKRTKDMFVKSNPQRDVARVLIGEVVEELTEDTIFDLVEELIQWLAEEIGSELEWELIENAVQRAEREVYDDFVTTFYRDVIYGLRRDICVDVVGEIKHEVETNASSMILVDVLHEMGIEVCTSIQAYTRTSQS